MTGRRRAPRRAWYTTLRAKPARLAVVVAAAAVTAAGTVFALAMPSSSAGNGAHDRPVPPYRAYVAPAVASSAQALPGGLIPAHRGRRPTIRSVTTSTLPPGVPSSVPPGSTPPPLTVEVATSPAYGPVLVTPAGMTLYRHSGTCSCDRKYQALLAQSGHPPRLPPLLHGRLGTVTLPDGTLQATFDGWPLYLYTGDRVPGDANGVNLDWQVIKSFS